MRDDILTQLRLRDPFIYIASFNRPNLYYEVRQKQSYDWPVAAAAVSFKLDGGKARNVKIVLGHVGPTPVVAADLGAASEMLLAPPRVRPEQRTGWCVPADNAEALAEAIGNALDLGATAREALAVRARAHIESEFSLDRMKREMLDLYSALLERRGTPTRGLSQRSRPAAGNR